MNARGFSLARSPQARPRTIRSRVLLLLLVPALVAGLLSPALAGSRFDRDDLFDEYFERFDRVESADDHLELALWCRQNSLDCQYQLHLDAALRIDPDHERSRNEVGYTRYEGEIAEYSRKKWLNAEEAKEAGERDAELARIREADLDRRREDKMLTQVDALVAKIRKDPYLGKINMVHSENYLPHLMFVENGRKFHFDQIGVVLQEYMKFFRETFGDPFRLSEVDQPLVILAFKDRKGYDDYCQHLEGRKPLRSRAAHYSPLTHEIVVHGWESITQNPFRPVLNNSVFTHEATHQIFHHYILQHTKEPLVLSRVHWFQEGIAEYLGTFYRSPVSRDTGERRYVFGYRSASRIAELRAAVESGAPMYTLQEMLTLPGQMEMYKLARERDPSHFEGMISRFYAQSWAFIYFLRESESGRFWKPFVEYVKRELRGESNVHTALETLKIEDLEELDKEWQKWIREVF